MHSTTPQSESLLELRRVIARQAREVRRLTRELQAAEQRERARIAERLHQDLQQLLAAANLKLSSLQRQISDETHRQTLSEIRALLEQATTSARSLAVDLAPPALQEGLAAALHWLATKMQRDHGLQVDLELEPGCEIADLPRREVLFQCIRELLFNVHKHAGVNQARVTLRPGLPGMRGMIEALVCDQGCGIAGHDLGFGLRTIQARLQNLGGTLVIRSSPSGITARIQLPII